jgi:hypothetical protein
MTRKYYGFEFWDGTRTTTGDPNQRTKRMSIAGELKVFDNTTARSIWVREYAKYPRITIYRHEIRDYHLGMSIAAFNEMLENLS